MTERRFADIVAAIAGIVAVGFIVDMWAEGAISRRIREALAARMAMTVSTPVGEDAIPEQWVSGLIQEARSITRAAVEGSTP